MQSRVRENRKITITNEHCDIGAVARGDFAGIADRQKVFNVGIVEQRATAAFTKGCGAQGRSKLGRPVDLFRHGRRRLMSELRN
jgi:hypothetical protein